MPKAKFYSAPLYCAECGQKLDTDVRPATALYHPKYPGCHQSGKFFTVSHLHLEEVEKRIPLGLGSRR